MKITIFLAIILFALNGCRTNSDAPLNGVPPPQEGSLTVSAAVSLKDAFQEIGALYRERTGVRVSFNFGASGVLQKQIETGAPVDVFASAGALQMDELAAKNLVDGAARRIFARNTLVLITPRDSALGIKSFADLAKPEVRKIAVGNPKTVPAGQYTEEMLQKTNLKNAVEPKLITAEDVRQVLDYVVRGETDAGIVYATDALAAGDKARTAAVADENAHAPVLYPIAVVRDSPQKASAQAFVDLVLSREGQEILRRYGFAAAEK